jgi:cyanophycin synthetase
VRLVPLHVIGDGKRTVAELLEIRNQNLCEADVAAGLYPVEVGDDVLRMLARHGLSPEARPAAGYSLQLRSIANMAAGGTLHDCTEDTHPDNREMAESIARGFQLDAVGIDFMTRDISKSWRESDCAVIEVNTTPGINTDPSAVQIIAARFPAGVDGRIPSIVLIGAEDSAIDGVAQAVGALGKRVGQTNGSETLLAGMPRCNDNETLPQRIRALILDSSCESLVIGATPQEIERHGFPLDRCDLALIEEGVSLSTSLRQLIEDCSEEVIDGLNGEDISDLTSASITRLVR